MNTPHPEAELPLSVARLAASVLGVSTRRHHGVVLPAATVDRVLEQLLEHGRLQQGDLGIAAQPVRAVLAGAPAAVSWR